MSVFEQDIMQTAIQAAKQGTEILLNNLDQSRTRKVESKAAFDFVTQVDRDSEQAIVECINKKFPNHSILAEERGADSQPGSYCWIIDPLDGTTNYIHGYPFFSISIALQHNDQIIFGLVYDPIRRDTFFAFRNKGAFLNERPIKISEQQQMNQALIATGFPFRDKTKISQYLASFSDVFRISAGIRRTGSAALDLAYTACGRVEGFWEIGLNLWDIAAGVLLIQEAGGLVTDFSGEQDYLKTGNVVAGNRYIHPKLLSICKQHLSWVFFN